MDLRGSIRALTLALAAALVVLSLTVLSVSAATDCSVSVAPRAGAAGTVFVFRGSGFVPTTLTLEKNGEPAGEHPVEVTADDEWQVSVRSRPGDEGSWTAALIADECTGTAEFRVTLAPTDAAGGAATSTSTVPLVALVVVVVAGASGGLVLGRRFAPRAIDNRQR